MEVEKDYSIDSFTLESEEKMKRYRKPLAVIFAAIIMISTVIVLADSGTFPAGPFGSITVELTPKSSWLFGNKYFTASNKVSNAVPILILKMDVYNYPEGGLIDSKNDTKYNTDSMSLDSTGFKRSISAHSTHEIQSNEYSDYWFCEEINVKN